LEKWLDLEEDFDKRAILAEIHALHQVAEATKDHDQYPGNLRQNIDRLSHIVGLSKADSHILAFAVLLNIENNLSEATGYLSDLAHADMCRVLSVILDLSTSEVHTSLSSRGALMTSGLLSVDNNRMNLLRHKLDVLSSDFAHSLVWNDGDPIDLVRDIIRPAKPGSLHFDDFHHLEKSLKILVPYLRHALANRQQGVNIFLYGVPGTGKTELARLLAGEMNCELFEIASEDEDGDTVNGSARLRAFRLAQSFLANRPETLLLFDEVEDVFDDGVSYFFTRRASTSGKSSKAWINRTLEENPVPAIWISNSAYCLDAAYIRRFDMVIEMPIPPKAQRERIVRTICEDMLPPETIRRIAETENLAPAVIARAVKVAGRIQDEIGENNVARSVEYLIDNTLVALNKGKLKKANDPNRLPETYDPAFINADTDLVKVAEGLAKTKSGRLCLYGPPGTGKTAFGRWLADTLGVQLVIKRASDLISKWVGGTEKNIAQSFAEAEEEGAILLIDEMDSFLQDRRQASKSWEVTSVNEMLTQMESFSGIFIATTNLMDGLDQAALRRFDLKVKVDYLQTEQSWQLFQRHCAALSLEKPSASVRKRIERLPYLTPGDFATVNRQSRFRPLETPSAFVSALEQECEIKEEGRQKSIGFL
jgi:SpoVK/Ycf46/Vps4 family AAA+-type ATPase